LSALERIDQKETMSGEAREKNGRRRNRFAWW
jgi:hypothetical protein